MLATSLPLWTERGELPDASSALTGCRGPSAPRAQDDNSSASRDGCASRTLRS
jgi:hypothetical protein